MTQEEKELLLKDLCGRLPFHAKVAIDFEGYLEVLPDDENLEYPYRKNLNFILDYKNKTIEDISKEPHILYAYPCTERFAMLNGYTYELDYGVPVEFIKPYLRPMSSMTEEEFTYIKQRWVFTEKCRDENDIMDVVNRGCVEICDAYSFVEWLNANHFDYRGLIAKSLALKATEGMYNTKNE